MKKILILVIIFSSATFLRACKNQTEMQVKSQRTVELNSWLDSNETFTKNLKRNDENYITGMQENSNKDFYLDFSTNPNFDELSRAEKINFHVRVEKDTKLKEFVFDFWDGVKTVNAGYWTVDHTYRESGVYKVSLTAIDEKWNEKTTSKEITIKEIAYPIAAYKIIDNEWFYKRPGEWCQIKNNENPEAGAYSMKQNEMVTIDATISVNPKWKNDTLEYFYKYENEDKIFTSSSGAFYWSFIETGCHNIELIVFDKESWKKDSTKIRFNVY